MGIEFFLSLLSRNWWSGFLLLSENRLDGWIRGLQKMEGISKHNVQWEDNYWKQQCAHHYIDQYPCIRCTLHPLHRNDHLLLQHNILLQWEGLQPPLQCSWLTCGITLQLWDVKWLLYILHNFLLKVYVNEICINNLFSTWQKWWIWHEKKYKLGEEENPFSKS